MALTWYSGTTLVPADTVTGPAQDARISLETALGRSPAVIEEFTSISAAANLTSLVTAVGTITAYDGGTFSVKLGDPEDPLVNNGRFDTSGVATWKWINTQVPLRIDFSQSRNVGGLYVTDWGDFGMELTIVLYNGTTQVGSQLFTSGGLGLTEAPNGTLIFLGWIGTEGETVTAVEIQVQQLDPGDPSFEGVDVIGIDSIFVDQLDYTPPAPDVELRVTRGWGATGNVVTLRFVNPG